MNAFAPSWKLAKPLPTVILVCLVTVVCYYADEIVYVLGIPPEHIASFWPATPFLVAVLVLVPKKIWPLLIAAGLAALAIADLKGGMAIVPEIWFSLGNLVDVLVAAVGLDRLFRGTPQLRSVKALAKYLGVAVILAPCVSALIGARGLGSNGYWLEWRIWFFADALGFLTVTPAILSWVQGGRAWARDSRNFLELTALLAWLVVFGYPTFLDMGWRNSPALFYLLVPALLLAALRLGMRGVSTSMAVITFLAIWGAAHDRGPFTGQGPLNNALSLQLFLFFAAIPFMALAVLVEEEKETRQELIDERAQLTEAQRLAQMGSWRWEPSTDTVTWSEELYRITGRDPRLPAPTYKEHPQLFTPESWARLQSAVEETLRTGAGYELDLEIVRPDGTTRWLMARGEGERDDTGLVGHLHGTVKDITERKKTEEALSRVSQRLIEAQEEERTRIARELHDDINQRIGLLAVRLDGLRHDLHASADKLRRELGTARKQVEDLGSDVQALSHRLHSSKLEYMGLVAASAGFCRELAERQNVEIDFQSQDIPKNHPPEIALCLFRVLQEALHNAVRHSGARRFKVSLTSREDEIELRVEDPGVGFDPERAIQGHGLGLTSMRERLKLVDGQLAIDSKPQQGTRIQARVPVNLRVKSVGAAG